MSEVQRLAARIQALAEAMGRKPSTISRMVLGSGARLGELEAGKSTMTLDVFERVEREVARLERETRRAA